MPPASLHCVDAFGRGDPEGDVVLSDLLNVAVLVFAVSSMLSVGLTYTLGQIVEPLRNVRLVGVGLLANFVVVPLWALLIVRMLSLDDPYEVGIMLVASAAGAAFLVKLVQLSDGDVAFSASLLVLLLPATVIYMPLVLPFIAPDADVEVWAIARPLVFATLLPLVVGTATLAVLPGVAARVRPLLGPVSMGALVATGVLTVAANAGDVVEVLGERVIIAALLLIAGSFAVGFVLGAPDHHRDEIALATAQRNIAAATVVATQTIGDPDTVVTVVVTSTVGMTVLFPLTTQLKKRSGRTAQAERAGETR